MHTHTHTCKHVHTQPGVHTVGLAECSRYSFMTSSRSRPLLSCCPALCQRQGDSFILNRADGEAEGAHSGPEWKYSSDRWMKEETGVGKRHHQRQELSLMTEGVVDWGILNACLQKRTLHALLSHTLPLFSSFILSFFISFIFAFFNIIKNSFYHLVSFRSQTSHEFLKSV